MSERALDFFPTIVSPADNLTIVNHNGANGNLSALTCMTRLL
jgi:hypothetical protein